MKQLLSSHQDKNKLQTKLLYLITKLFFKETPLTQYYPKHGREIISIPKILKQEKIQPSCLMKPSVEITFVSCYYQKRKLLT